MSKKSYRLTACYSYEKHGFGLDPTIRGLVGRPEDGAGTFLKTWTRDISFTFKQEDAAKKALARLRKKKIKAELVAEED